MALFVGRMGRAIDLHNKFFFAANEVSEIGTNRLLPNEFEPAEKTVPKPPPNLTFGFGPALAQLTRTTHFLQLQSAHEILR